MNQKAMDRVLLALLPIIFFGIGSFGWRVLFVVLVSVIFAFLTEWFFKRKTKKPYTKATFVSAILFALTLPPRTPYWIVALGIIFGITFAREVFGGFGRNVFNPAITARAFVYVNFSNYLTAQWSASSDGLLTGFTKYITEPIDVLAQSTPMLIYRESGELASYFDVIIGNISGSIGEVSGILIILAGIYLVLKKAAYKETIISVILGFIGMSIIFNLLGVAQVPNPLWGIFSGGLLFGAVFMATDPITSPKTYLGRWIYGIMIGVITVVIRGFALFAGGIMFAILVANIFVPILDVGVNQLKKRGA
ncbi:MAG TPA: RnfABCDGE type electron transport complex subunit D [Clostridia bacterium]|nr:RnfABCDGE type electron transport complex subunit D [Clostridia bacterium]